MSDTPPRPSMADVAALAGVSGQTVSRVVNGVNNVGHDTRRRVEAALAELGYRPHRAARALRTGRTQVIGVIVATLESVGNSLMLEALVAAAARHEHAIALVTMAEPTADAFDTALTQLAEQDVDGVIVVNEASRFAGREATTTPLPIVLIDADDAAPFSTVRSDHEQGAADATAMVLDARPVHHVGGPAESFAARLREAGWRRTLRDAGIECPDVVRGDWTAASGFRAGRVLASDPSVSAVFCANDQMALGVMRALHEAGRRIPQDVAVIGFDGIADAADFWPPLTTMQQDFPALADRAVAVLLDGADAPAHAVLPVRSCVRASTRS